MENRTDTPTTDTADARAAERTSRAPAPDAGPQTSPKTGPASTVESAKAPSDGKSPGAALAQARRARKMEVVRIATELRLTPATVDALERDDYAHLPSAVFVAGYIRSYARLLDLDAQPLIERFRALHPDAEAPPPRVVPHAKDTMDKQGSSAPLLVALLLALAIGGGYFWWVGHREATTAVDSSPSATTVGDGAEAGRGDSAVMATRPPSDEPLDQTGQPGAPLADDSADGPADDLAGRLAGPASTDRSLDPTGPDLTFDAPDSRAMADQPGAELLAQADAIPTTNEDATGSDEPGVDDAEPQLTNDIRQPSALTPLIEDNDLAGDTEIVPGTASENDSEVTIAFSGPCWVDVRDATGEVQLFGEMGDGDSHVLGGEPPYSLVIGNASVTEITVGGRPFDVRAVAKGNVARFELDPAALPQAADEPD
jgi:cytoskeleton protein RodZ